jgi:FkbM family methyltransferase
MPSQGFLYRRVARLLPCVFSQVGHGVLTLRNKYDIASVRDVFLSTHYWRAFEHLPTPPQLIVDLGAHCGHFSLLCHLALLEKFGADTAGYFLFEALPRLLPQIRRVADEAGFLNQVKVVQGLVGRRKGTAAFAADPRNLLASHTEDVSGANAATTLSYIDLDTILPPGRTIDILKIDIEGSEYDLLANYPHVLQAARLVLLELHGPTERQLEFEHALAKLGFAPLSPAIVKENERLVLYGSGPRNGAESPT